MEPPPLIPLSSPIMFPAKAGDWTFRNSYLYRPGQDPGLFLYAFPSKTRRKPSWNRQKYRGIVASWRSSELDNVQSKKPCQAMPDAGAAPKNALCCFPDMVSRGSRLAVRHPKRLKAFSPWLGRLSGREASFPSQNTHFPSLKSISHPI